LLTLRYHGFVPMLVEVNDNSNPALFNDWVNPGETFVVRARPNGSFAGNNIYIELAGIILNATIKVNCGLQFDPFTYFGMFTIVNAESKNGGAMCCTSNTGSASPPEIYGCPTTVAASTSTSCNAVATWKAPTAPDCDVVSLTSNFASGSAFPIGTTTVTYTAKNTNNLTSTCTFNVVVTDATAPTVKTPTPNVTVNAGANCSATATWTAPQFVDNCTVASVTSTHQPGSLFVLGTTTVIYTAKDAAGNATTSQFVVTVKDATAPTLTNCPADVKVQSAVSCAATATWTPPTFADGCSAITVSSTHTPGTTFNAGSTPVTYTAKDLSGNITTCTFNVIVLNQSSMQFASCPSDTTISTTSIAGMRYSWKPAVATDVCLAPEVSSDHQPGDQFPIGVTTVTYTAKDLSGNKITCSFDVTVKQEHTKLDVSQLLSPDGNSVNDTWTIGNIELYKENKVTIVDRWGSVVYTESGYDNEQRAWRGRTTQGSLVPAGTYFYTISVRSGNQNSETRGFIEVVR
jgi:gliding motility-associated-like protein